MAHQQARDAGRVSGSEILSPRPKRSPGVSRTDNTAVVSYINHRGGEADMGPGSGGPLRYSGDSAMSPLVLSTSSSPTGAGCHGTDVAEASSVRLSPGCSAPWSSGESAPGRSSAAISSPVLAGPRMVLGSDFPPRRLSFGDSSQEGSPLTSGGLHPRPEMSKLGVAPEGAQLVASGLSTEVVGTVLQSRAPSARKLYALK